MTIVVAQFRNRQGRPVFDLPPRYRTRPLPKAINFAKTGFGLMRALTPYLTVG